MESVPRRVLSPLEKERANKEQIRNRIFDQLVATKVLESFHDDIDEANISEEAYKEIVDAFAQLSEDDKRAVLAIPAQLRPELFKRYALRIDEGEITGADIVSDILEKANRYGFTIGFHLSPQDVKPEKDGTWHIKGTEPDHRHDDLPMAYYSLDYAHRYLRKPTRYLYVIRAELGDKSAHYRDNDRSWGHATSLSIVDQIDMQALEAEMEQRFKLMEQNERRDAA